jgi:hypothetical protein
VDIFAQMAGATVAPEEQQAVDDAFTQQEAQAVGTTLSPDEQLIASMSGETAAPTSGTSLDGAVGGFTHEDAQASIMMGGGSTMDMLASQTQSTLDMLASQTQTDHEHDFDVALADHHDGDDHHDFDLAGQMGSGENTADVASQLSSLTDEDPTTYGAFDDSGVIGGGTCMGGYLKDLDLYLDCTQLLGFLAIVNSDETDLEKLANLESITYLEGMQAPNGTALLIANNSALLSSQLASLNLVAGAIVIEGNAVLQTSTYPALYTVGVNDQDDSIVVSSNDHLASVSFDNITQVPGNVALTDNMLLAQIYGSPTLTIVGGGVTIANNGALEAVDLLTSVQTIGATANGDSLVINDNPMLRDLSGLRELQGMLKGAVKIASNEELRTIDGMQKVISLGEDGTGVSLNITGNELLHNITALANLQKVTGSVVINLNPSMKVLAGLQALSEIGCDMHGDSLTIYSNIVLTSLIGFSGLTQPIDGAITIENNPGLYSLQGLNNIKAITGKNKNGNSLRIIMNDNLVNMSGLDGLAGHVAGAIIIDGNPVLQNVDSLGGVESIDGANDDGTGLAITNNAEMQTIHGVENMTHIEGCTQISHVACVEDAEVAVMAGISQSTQIDNTTIHDACAHREDYTPMPVDIGNGDTNICGGTTQTADSLWEPWSQFGSSGLYVDVDTTKCNFAEEHPRYLSSVAGDNAHWQLTGVNSIYTSTSTGFRVYVWHPVMRGEFMKYFAHRYNWKLNWLADTGSSSGITRAGETGWTTVPGTKNALYVNVDTLTNQYYRAPRYVTSMHGGRDHWKLQGGHAVYSVSQTGFRIFVVYPVPITPEQAEEYQWQVAWAGSIDDRISGNSEIGTWEHYRASSQKDSNDLDLSALYTDVDASASQFDHPVSYVTSVSGTSHHWMVTGAGCIYKESQTGFRVYLDHAKSVSFANAAEWRVNFIAYSAAVDCTLSGWSTWSACSDIDSCEGTQTRYRNIVLRAYFGGNCSEPLTGERACDCTPVPDVDCVVSPWGAFSECSHSCGADSHKVRERTIVTIKSGSGADCPPLHEQDHCEHEACPYGCTVSEWSSWETCTLSCGTGSESRSRSVVTFDASGDFLCPGLEEDRACNTELCPIDCVMSAWSAYTTCSATCDWGMQSATRSITTHPAHGGEVCTKTADSRPCHETYCPIHCVVSDWGGWGGCSKSCGRGTKEQTREIVREDKYGGSTCPELTRSTDCNVEPCAVDCVASAWSAYSTCTTSCGTGSKSRSRSVIQEAAHGGVACPELDEDCCCNEFACPVDCVVSTWQGWGSCSQTCDGGTMTNSRTTETHASFGGEVCPDLSETIECNIGACPVHCTVSDYTPWSACSESCGGGIQTANRAIVTHAQNGGYTCPDPLNAERPCNEEACPVACTYSGWSDYSTCTKSCWDGQAGTEGSHERTRELITEASNGGTACDGGGTTSTEDCNTHACPSDCAVSTWSQWNLCSATCGLGFKERLRTVDSEATGGGVECPLLREELVCDTGACPEHCQVSEWSAWSTCPAECGSSATQSRSRSVIDYAAHGGLVCPGLTDSQACNSHPCPIDCQVGDWYQAGSYNGGDCSKSCGSGTQVLVRDVLQWNIGEGEACPAVRKTVACNTQPCPVDCVPDPDATWTTFSSCSKTCEAGIEVRTRAVLQSATAGGQPCPNVREERACNAGVCPVHCEVSGWGGYDDCSAACGGGNMRRNRTIIQQDSDGGSVCPSLHEDTDCNTQCCAVNCVLSGWSDWVPYLGGGADLRRTRQVTTAAQCGGTACTATAEIQDVTTKPHCPDTPMPAGDWSGCTRKCDGGYQVRFHNHAIASQTAVLCYHVRVTQRRSCNIEACTNEADSNWVQAVVPPVQHALGHNGPRPSDGVNPLALPPTIINTATSAAV